VALVSSEASAESTQSSYNGVLDIGLEMCETGKDECARTSVDKSQQAMGLRATGPWERASWY